MLQRETRDWYIEKVACFLNTPIEHFHYQDDRASDFACVIGNAIRLVCGLSEIQRRNTLINLNLNETAFTYKVIYQIIL